MSEEQNVSKADTPSPERLGSANLPCPFCGSPCDNCRGGESDEDGWLGCDNQNCPASRLVMTAEQWNTRYSHNNMLTVSGGPGEDHDK